MVKALLARIVILAVAFLVVDGLMDTVDISGGFLGAVGLSVVYGISSAVIGTALRFLTLPLVLLTVGLFEFVINGALLLVTEWLTGWIELDRFLTAVGASVILSIVSTVLGFLVVMVFPETRRKRS